MAFTFQQLKNDLAQAHDWLQKEYSHISTGRANPALLDGVLVESYGTTQPIKNIASVSVEDARSMRIMPWDKSQIGAIQKAIQILNLPLSTSADSEGVRVNIPQLTEETRKSLVKTLKEKLEQSRITVRQYRQDTDKAIDTAEKEGEFGEDEKKRKKEEMQKLIDETNKDLEHLFTQKEIEVMTI